MKIICSKCGKNMKNDHDSSNTHNINNALNSMCVHCNAFFCNECMANKIILKKCKGLQSTFGRKTIYNKPTE